MNDVILTWETKFVNKKGSRRGLGPTDAFS